MEEIREFIEESFTPRVEEDMNGIKVVFTSTVGDGIIWFEPAKRGWSKKPLSTNQYIINTLSKGNRQDREYGTPRMGNSPAAACMGSSSAAAGKTDNNRGPLLWRTP